MSRADMPACCRLVAARPFAARPANGETRKVLRKKRGQRWRRASIEAGAQGWVNGRYLRESRGPK